jgi:hypothetical protein
MWSLTLSRVGRTSGAEKFGPAAKKYFFDTIDPTETSAVQHFCNANYSPKAHSTHHWSENPGVRLVLRNRQTEERTAVAAAGVVRICASAIGRPVEDSIGVLDQSHWEGTVSFDEVMQHGQRTS